MLSSSRSLKFALSEYSAKEAVESCCLGRCPLSPSPILFIPFYLPKFSHNFHPRRRTEREESGFDFGIANCNAWCPFLLSPSWRFCSSKVGFLKLELTLMRRSTFNLTNRQTFNLYRICALHRTKPSLPLWPAHKCTSLRDLSFGDDTHSWIMILENAGGGR